jgi:hypothetical protein
MKKVWWRVQAISKNSKTITVKEVWTLGENETKAKERAFDSNYIIQDIKRLRDEEVEIGNPLGD